MKTKICFKCNTEKLLSEYYAHKQMADGLLGKCKSCTKTDSDKREKVLRQDVVWVEKEKKRAREKYHRLGYKDIHKPTKEEKKLAMGKYNAKYPEKRLAKLSPHNIKPLLKGNELHHWSYNKEHYTDIIELSVLEHSKLHRYMIYDQERMMYRRIDTNELLDTKEKHVNYYNNIKHND